LAPALEICHAARSDWDPENNRAETIARVSVLFDRETMDEYKRPLEVLQSLRDDPPTPQVEKVTLILWTEEGQALCDRHFRGQKRNYKLEPNEIRRSLAALKPAVPRVLADASATPVRLSSSIASAAAAARKESEREEQNMETKAMSDVFEKRRQALRDTPAPEEDSVDRTVDDDEIEQKVAQITRRARNVDYEDATVEASPELAGTSPIEAPDYDAPREAHVPARRSAPPPPNDREENMDNIRSITSARDGRREENEITERLNDLRSQLRQIQRIAGEGEELLASLAPQIEEFTAMFGHLESMVQRWKGSADGAAPAPRGERAA
jgi:hypothetical protein